ncbi:MAG: hypothetical protein H0V30_09395 [Chitinophagaceae bacterium]|nr:hypothetical protein [Chitinophagaceae bacterium]
MKQRLYIFLLFVIFYSCKKDISLSPQPQAYMAKIKTALLDSLTFADFDNLYFEKAVLTKIDSLHVHLLRIPFKNKKFSNDFLLLKTKEDGSIIKGTIVHLSDNEIKAENNGQKFHFNGSISLTSLNRQNVLHSKIKNGYIEAFYQKETFRTLSMADPYQTLPEVIIVSSVSVSGYSYYTWASLLTLADYGGTNNYYSLMDSYYLNSGGGGGSIQTDPYYLVDIEHQIKKSAIDINKYLKCFSTIPDAGSTCSIEIFTDIPVDNDPNKLFNWQNESPGHTFIQLKKKNGLNSVVQNIGFYPNKDWKSIVTPAPINGKFVDNGEHETNASLLMNVSIENFQRILNQISYLSGFVKYDIDEYNCTDFALEVFNTIRSKKIEIPKFNIPNGETPFGTSTPQGLYIKLKSMKVASDPEAANISLPGVKGWVAKSKGPCN